MEEKKLKWNKKQGWNGFYYCNTKGKRQLQIIENYDTKECSLYLGDYMSNGTLLLKKPTFVQAKQKAEEVAKVLELV